VAPAGLWKISLYPEDRVGELDARRLAVRVKQLDLHP
jgi:hypothetical protein